ncbi:hypothetical protein SAMN05446635_9040 [Burkholderia sp. OK233]|nr:hypothetical protein SAMN05446635_9040 [Burkholderia sp. OK233]
MSIDFHYGVVNAMARLGGMPSAEALTVAHACQYVDDPTTPGLLDFEGGEMFERFPTAHSLFDYQNAFNQGNRLTWVPFHFLPARIGESLEERAICRPNSNVAKTVVRRAIEHLNADNGLHRLGVTLHTYVDTWAHQGFSGIKSDFNSVSHLVAEDCTHLQWYEYLKRATEHLSDAAKSDVLSRAFPLGHGAALHYPDQPWANWTYTNGKGRWSRVRTCPTLCQPRIWRVALSRDSLRATLSSRSSQTLRVRDGPRWSNCSRRTGAMTSRSALKAFGQPLRVGNCRV